MQRIAYSAATRSFFIWRNGGAPHAPWRPVLARARNRALRFTRSGDRSDRAHARHGSVLACISTNESAHGQALYAASGRGCSGGTDPRVAPDGKVTICHVASDAEDCTRTEVLPAFFAKRHLSAHTSDFAGSCEGGDFVMVAVSGTLEEGFPLRPNLNYVSPTEQVNAVFLGHALIQAPRGGSDSPGPLA